MSASGAGRGELFKLLQAISQSQPFSSSQRDSAALPSQPPADAPRPGGGRGLVLSRLTWGTAQPSKAPAPQPLSQTTLGRSKLFSTVPVDPRILKSPTELSAHTSGEVVTGAARSYVDPALVKPAGNSPPSTSMEKLSLAENADSDEESGVISMQGHSGTKLNVTSNYVALKTQRGKGIFQYVVKFEPDVDSQNTRYRIVRQLADKIGDTKSFDGGILYLPVKLPEDVTVLSASLPSDGTEVKVKITFVKSIRIGHHAAVHLYNVLFRRIMNILGMALHGRHFFEPAEAKFVPEHKLEIWPGFVKAIHEYEGGVMLRCDTSQRVLRTETVHEVMTDLATLSKGKKVDAWHQDFVDLVINQRVLTRYNNKVYGIHDVDFNATPRDTFMRNGIEVSYMEYYKNQYNIDIWDPSQPLLKSHLKLRIKGEETTHIVDLIPELCFITGITDTMRADHKAMKALAKSTRMTPSQRHNALCKFINNVNCNKEARALLDNWGLSLNSDTVGLTARVLQSEDIIFGKGSVQPGSLQADWSRGANFHSALGPVKLEHWTIICTKRDVSVIEGFVRMCHTVCPKLGIEFRKPTIVDLPNDNTHYYIESIRKLKDEPVQIVVVVMPVSRSDKYAAVKKMCCLEIPIPSQVIITRTIRHPDRLRSLTQNIMLQINCKLGGTLWTVKIPIKNTMVVGMDSFHGPKLKTSSFGAIVASMNSDLTRWYSKVYRSGPGIELISGLCSAMTSCLHKYREANGKLPDQIYIYRDGVGDGQIPACVDYEMPQVMAACIRMEPNYAPRFLVVIVQKKSSTKIYEMVEGEPVNPPPGTVVDHSLTHRDMYDFFLVSQCVREGTVSPTHYVVAHNSTSMDTDKVQRLSYKLSHLYYNWCGTVRVPAPCQYAHKLATLVGECLHREADESLADKLYYL